MKLCVYEYGFVTRAAAGAALSVARPLVGGAAAAAAAAAAAPAIGGDKGGVAWFVTKGPRAKAARCQSHAA